MSPLLKNLIIALSIVMLVGFVYFFVLGGDEGETEVIPPESDAVRQSARILSDTRKVDSFNLDGDILRDRRFTSLQEVRIDTQLVDVGTGRPNPFEVVP